TANFIGMAPDAHIVNIKVADASGATDVSQVIAAIDWVVQHKDDNGLNIRVLNLSFGTDSKQSYLLDPLTFAAEVAWRKGIVVVAAAGNTGQVGLTDPASDPFVIAVGATDTKAEPNGLVTDAVAPYSSLGNGLRNPDTVAPGSHIQSLRDPGSYLDQHYGGTGQINDRFFRGSGTSQAAAVVSGGAALIVQQHPDYTPDQIKYLLTNNTSGITGARAASAGKGRISLDRTLHASLFKNKAAQMFVPANGWGSLDGARGTAKLMRDGVELTGNVDIFGHAFNSAAIATAELTGNSWSGGDWNGNSWSGNSWSGNSWSGVSWSGNTWSSDTWV
ncbi:MAG: serine protease AprX, partial [Acidimicrobiaceae bacterium]|nr:serine protease AprX [Acidimicrobiaceae bacterium]